MSARIDDLVPYLDPEIAEGLAKLPPMDLARVDDFGPLRRARGVDAMEAPEGVVANIHRKRR